MFLWGFAGSAAVEVVTVLQIFQKDPVVVPIRYQRFWFWVTRFCVGIMAGGLALAYEVDKPLLALNIGAATPLIIQTFAKGFERP